MSAINQMFMGLFSAAGAAVSGIVSLVNKWYPIYTREVNANVRWVNGKAWMFNAGPGVATSENGVDWTTVWPTSELGIAGNVPVNDVVYANGLYVMVGNIAGSTSLILTSTNGVTWTRRTTAHILGLTSIDYSPSLGLFLAGGGSGSTAYSADGINWTNGASTGGATSIVKVVWGGGQFALINNSAQQIFRSSNGTSFTAQSTAIGFSISDIAYSPNLGLWAIARQSGSSLHVMTSPDLNTWTVRTVTGSTAVSATGITWSGSRFIVTSNGGGVGSSADGITWNIANNNITQLGRMCAMTSGAVIAACFIDKGSAITYNDGATWGTSITEIDTVVGQFRSNATKPINAITYSGGRYWIAASNVTGQLYYSTDKKVWFSTYMPAAAGTNYRAVYAASAATPYWVATGTTGTAGQIYSSTNGDSWTARSVTTQGTGWNDAATDGSITVMVNSSGEIATTTDGVSFTNRSKLVTSLRGVVYAGGKFVAVGQSTAVYSIDGINWTSASTSFGAFNASKLIHDGTQFVAVGTGTATINTKVSADGITWSTGPVAPWGATGVSSLAHNGSVYVAMTNAAGRVVYVGSTLSSLSAVNLPITITAATNGLVAVGSEFTLQSNNNNYQLTSTDNGVTWTVWKTAEPIGAGSLSTTTNLLGSLDGSVVAFLPFNGSTNSGFGKYDPDTKTFSKYSVNPAAGALATYSVIKVGSTYVAGLGNGTTSGNISTSTDLGGWTTRQSVAATVRSIASNGDGSVLIAGTHSGSTTGILGPYRSIDGGQTWAQRNTGVNVAKVIWANNQFVAVGSNATASVGVIQTSPDGLIWTTRYTGPATGNTDAFSDVAYGNGIYIATSFGSNFKFYTSTDGITWTGQGLVTYAPMSSIAFGNGAFWALGNSGSGYTTTNGTAYSSTIMAGSNVVGLVWNGLDAFYAMTARGSLFKYTPQ